MYRNHNICRACGFGKDPNAPGIKVQPNHDKLIPVFDLGVQPLANDFRKEGESCAGYFPLKVMYCPRCSLAQLSVVVDPEVLYSHYAYVTSKSDMMKEHFGKLWGAIVEERNPRKVLEIGSNDGDFLHYAMDHGAALCVGVDPAVNLAAIAKDQGVQTIPLMFNEMTAKTVAGWHKSFDVIVARHVFCHMDDWQGFIRACELVSDEDTLIVIEAPYAGDTLKNCEFDQCLPPGQKIITEYGIAEIQEVKLGDSVLTHTGHFRPVTKVFERPYSGDVIEVRSYGQSTPLVVTPEHPIFVMRGKSVEFVEAKDVRRGDKMMKPVVSDRCAQGAKLSVSHRVGRSKLPTTTNFPINEQLCKVMGFYLAEGFYYECKPGAAQVEFAFGKSESEKDLAFECYTAIRSLGGTVKVKLTKYGWHVYSYGHIARLLHQQMGTGAVNKKVPAWLYKEFTGFIRAFVYAYIRGDGYVYRDGNYWRGSTVSSQIAQGIAILANRLGYAVSINIGKSRGLVRIHKNLNWSFLEKPAIDILIRLNQRRKSKTHCDGNYQFSTIKSVTRKHYDGTVHNIEVAQDSSYVPIQGAVHNCYHEHMSFLSYKAVDALLAKSRFEIVDIQRYDIHGGTSALFLRSKNRSFPNKAVVRDFIANENLTCDDWKMFAVEARDQINRLSQTVRSLVATGKRVVGLGASAKSTVWVNACGFTRKEVAFIADNTPQKQLTFSPGTDIPIVDEGAILRELPDYVILWAWNYKEEILAKFDGVRKKGVKFIIPVPTITVV